MSAAPRPAASPRLHDPLPAEHPVVVVGAGVAGAATAHFLRAAGECPLILERHQAPGAEASGRSAGIVREDVADTALRPWTSAGAAAHRTGAFSPFTATGAFLLGRGDEDVSARVPVAHGRGRFFPGDGVVDVRALLSSWLEGQDVRWGVSVAAVLPASGGLVIETSAGRILARTIVNAAGAWAGELAGLPLEPRKRHLLRTEDRQASAAWPYVWDDAAGLYFRTDRGSILVCACDEAACLPGDNEVDASALDAIVAKVRRFQPGLLPLAVESAWAGQRTFAPDGRFVVGWDPHRRGLFWLAALGGHGVTVAPALGLAAAEAVLRGPDAVLPTDLAPFSPARLLPAPEAG